MHQQQSFVLCRRQPAIPPSTWGRASDIGYGVEGEAHAPFLDSNGEHMA